MSDTVSSVRVNRTDSLLHNTGFNLQCPNCFHELTLQLPGPVVCPACARQYPLYNNIPVIINEDKSIFSFDDFKAAKNLFFDISKGGNIKAKISSLLPSLSFNKISTNNFAKLKQLLLQRSTPARVLILGASIEGQGIGDFLATPQFTIIESDVSFGPRTAIVLDAHDIPYKNETFDCVIAQAVLEHVVDPERCVSEINRVLKPGGVVYSEIPFMQQVHGAAYDFTRYSLSGHRRLFRQFQQVSAGALAGPGTALGWAYTYFLLSLFGFNNRLRLIIKTFARLTGFWFKYFDHLTMHGRRSIDGASVTFFMGEKSNTVLTDRQVIQYYQQQ